MNNRHDGPVRPKSVPQSITIFQTLEGIVAECLALSTCLIVLSDFADGGEARAFIADKLSMRLAHAERLVREGFHSEFELRKTRKDGKSS